MAGLRAVIGNNMTITSASKEANRRWKKANPERVKEYQRKYQKKWRAANPIKQLERGWRRYGIKDMNAARYEELLVAQNGVCAICKKANTKPIRLSVDHDKATGKVRGLLCDRCNKALGQLGDTVEGLEAALNYLRAA